MAVARVVITDQVACDGRTNGSRCCAAAEGASAGHGHHRGIDLCGLCRRDRDITRRGEAAVVDAGLCVSANDVASIGAATGQGQGKAAAGDGHRCSHRGGLDGGFLGGIDLHAARRGAQTGDAIDAGVCLVGNGVAGKAHRHRDGGAEHAREGSSHGSRTHFSGDAGIIQRGHFHMARDDGGTIGHHRAIGRDVRSHIQLDLVGGAGARTRSGQAHVGPARSCHGPCAHTGVDLGRVISLDLEQATGPDARVDHLRMHTTGLAGRHDVARAGVDVVANGIAGQRGPDAQGRTTIATNAHRGRHSHHDGVDVGVVGGGHPGVVGRLQRAATDQGIGVAEDDVARLRTTTGQRQRGAAAGRHRGRGRDGLGNDLAALVGVDLDRAQGTADLGRVDDLSLHGVFNAVDRFGQAHGHRHATTTALHGDGAANDQGFDVGGFQRFDHDIAVGRHGRAIDLGQHGFADLVVRHRDANGGAHTATTEGATKGQGT